MAPESATARAGLIGAGVAVAGALAYIGLADPHRPGFLFPGCPFKALTGLDCPACGGLRMTHDLLNGDLAAAVIDNVFLLVALPALAVWLVVRWRRGLTLMPMAATVTVVVAAVAWTVVRNWPGFPLVPTVLTG
ncbi:DUF2752 domain-containing protein [Mycobacterium sp. ITM-2016-00316]|uniref:DUF2752 domain-containing protein n=1 Tax=Mycobacterium sp. ITM-2016-00316 TaxID=2099695 RepID=UPI000CFA47C7|nr:DUF2752 domain-containing protein [Mycobacterium sp. ITM-2016-00316]WNG80005.1 DUF2752 domain-containing protein [Mycobacterium sp. ITM-2016-00316]